MGAKSSIASIAEQPACTKNGSSWRRLVSGNSFRETPSDQLILQQSLRWASASTSQPVGQQSAALCSRAAKRMRSRAYICRIGCGGSLQAHALP